MALLFEGDLNLEATELRLGLPGTVESGKQRSTSAKTNKRGLIDMNKEIESTEEPNLLETEKCEQDDTTTRPSKAQIVGWPPVRSYRKNFFQAKKPEPESAGVYVKVSMDGAPFLRKIDLKTYKGYSVLLNDLEDMFKIKVGEYCEKQGYKRSEFVPTYEDKDGDWMLVGDVPWNMFITSCKRLRIMKGSEL